MKLNFLKAGTGDAIIVHHEGYNIIIDGGDDSKCLLSEVDKIHSKNEVIDLMIITHHDDDHIRGIVDLLNYISEKNYAKDVDFIKKVIFNSPRLALNKIISKEAGLLSYKQAYDVEELLSKINTTWDIYVENSDSIKLGDLEVEFLSPKLEDLNNYVNQPGVFLSGDYKCDWHSSMSVLDKHINDRSKDPSISNRSSIVVKLQADNKKVLLTGDVTADRFEQIINDLSDKTEENPLKFDLIKLPHHGSYRNINKNLLEKIKCNTFVISTNSKKHSLPNKRALLKVLKFSDRSDGVPINFIFNYDEALNNLGITSKEKKDYNFDLKQINKIWH